MTKLSNGFPSIVAMATTASLLLLLVENVIFAQSDGFRGQETVDVVPARMLINPGLYSAKHILLDLHVSTAECWVVECAQYVVGNFIYGGVGVLPCIENTAVKNWLVNKLLDIYDWLERKSEKNDLRDSILKNCACNTAGARVEDVGKMIL